MSSRIKGYKLAKGWRRRMNTNKKRIVSFLLVVFMLSGYLSGCSNSKTVSADVNQKLELAVKYLSEQKYEKAILAYQEVIKIDSKNITAYKGRSLAFVLQEKPDEAEKALHDGLKVLSNNEQLQLAIAGLMLDQNKGDQAEAIYKELINSDNPSLSFYQAYTYYLNRQGKQAEAIALLEQAAARNSKDYKLNSMLAELYFKSGEKEKALTAINKSLKAEPNQSAAYKQLAELYQDQWTELITLGEQYIQQNQAKTGQLLKLSALLGMGKYEDVIKLYGELATDVKDSARVRYIAAQAYTKLGKKDQSVELMKPIKIADIKDAGMLADMANFYLENGDKDKARKLALQGIDVDDTGLENYVIMYKSYESEDKKLAQMWAYKYVLASPLSYKGSLSNLADCKIVPGSQKQSESELTSQKIVARIVVDQDYAQRIHFKGDRILASVYLDTKNNIAYQGWGEYSDNWEPIIHRYHSPVLYTKENIPSEIINRMREWSPDHWDNLPSDFKYILRATEPRSGGIIGWASPVQMEGDIPLEEHLKRVGYPIENITFIDI
jgi:tetratricopeptide (TPR) repeat protein